MSLEPPHPRQNMLARGEDLGEAQAESGSSGAIVPAPVVEAAAIAEVCAAAEIEMDCGVFRQGFLALRFSVAVGLSRINVNDRGVTAIFFKTPLAWVGCVLAIPDTRSCQAAFLVSWPSVIRTSNASC